MSEKVEVKPLSDRELVICRIIDAPADKVFRAWTDPELMKLWFVPRPWSIAKAEVDLRVGGSNLVVMRSPEGQEFPNAGVFLEIVPNKKLVFTDAYSKAWEPSQKPMFTGVLTFEDLGNGKTKYTARALHWTVADRDAHEKMGFEQGWGICADQLEQAVSKL